MERRKQEALDYKDYLNRIVELTKQVSKLETQASYPEKINSPVRQALYDNLDHDEELAVRVDTGIQNVKKADWRGNSFKENEVRIAIRAVLGDDNSLVNDIFDIVKV